MGNEDRTDSKRIAALFENYADYLFNYAITRVNDEPLAEDLVQDTFVAAIISIKNFKSKSKESTWLTAILKGIAGHLNLDSMGVLFGNVKPFR
jgi:RNA polymerase sigma-70 factor (ECF subfamily)